MDQIGPYALRRRLGDTPVGELHEAIDRSGGRAVLLELVRDDLVRDGAVKEACLAEMRRLASLGIEGLATVVEPLDAQGKNGIVCRLPAGRSLRELMSERGRISWELGGELLGAVARVLGRLHGASPPLAHLDLRPDRIWLDVDGRVTVVPAAGGRLLADGAIGAARSVELLRYASPELLDGGAAGCPADCYALGLLLYELLGGAPPFQSSSPRTVINMHCAEAPPALPDAVRAASPRALLVMLDELLGKQPSTRPSAGDVVTRVEQLVPDRAKELLAAFAGAPARSTTAVGPATETSGRVTTRAPASSRRGPSDRADDRAAADLPNDEDTASEADDTPTDGAGEPGEPTSRQLSSGQIVALVVAATVLAALLAYCAAAAPDETAPSPEDPAPTRPLGPDPLRPEHERLHPTRPLAPDSLPPERGGTTTTGPLGPDWLAPAPGRPVGTVSP